MTKTHTPLIIEGKIYVVVDAPEKPYRYEQRLIECTKYETLPEDAPYWKERIGQRVEVEIVGCCNSHCTGLCITINSTTYAIPPQQKQDDGDLWDEAVAASNEHAKNEVCKSQHFDPRDWFGHQIDYLKTHYHLTKK